ncbi:MAG TPA: hypothetical protein VFP25_02215 [Nitrososphaeraceae archaeon]|nr:hypothetical protein [Nitrososphaeraceae archaeon]
MKSVTRSFRLEDSLSKILDEEADRMGISINALVNIIIKQYLDFTRYLSKIDMVIINRELLRVLLESLEEKEIYDIAILFGSSIPKDTILFWKKELSNHTVFEYLEKIVCRYGLLGTYDEISQNDIKTIVIRHRLGKKGSVFFNGYLKSTLKNTLGLDSSVELTESSVKIQIKI